MKSIKFLSVLFVALVLAFIAQKINKGETPIPKVASAAISTNKINQELHDEYHYPVVFGEEIESIPFLTLPFSKKESYTISEGWIYSDAELKITGVDPMHGGIDYALPYGTPVLSPVDGYAMASYQSTTLVNEDGSTRLYKDKPVNMGFGYFVRIYVPSMDRYVSLGHLSDISKTIPFSPPEVVDGGWYASNTWLLPEELETSPWVVKIKKGDVIGKVGYSGLTWGYDEYEEGAERPVVINHNINKSWDEPHIHFEEHSLDENYHAGFERDPYAIYNTYPNYPTKDSIMPLGKDQLFLLNKQGQPKYADEP